MLNKTADSCRIMGVDPGYDRLGLAVIEKSGTKEVLVHSECLETSSDDSIFERLRQVGENTSKIIDRYKPCCIVLETLFLAKNQKTAMRVSEARGIIIYEAVRRNIPVFEYSPMQIKMAITSDGSSDKDRMLKMLGLLISLPKKKALDDEYDAIAVALTHSAIKNTLSTRRFSCKK